MQYIRPDLGKHTLAYKGRRYWVIEIAEGEVFDYRDKSDCDYVLWDGEYGSGIATIKDDGDGQFTGKINSHVDLGTSEFSTLKEAVKVLSHDVECYLDAVVG